MDDFMRGNFFLGRKAPKAREVFRNAEYSPSGSTGSGYVPRSGLRFPKFYARRRSGSQNFDRGTNSLSLFPPQAAVALVPLSKKNLFRKY